MSLLFSGTWDHAVLAAAVQAATSAKTDGYLGRTAVQKIVYFLQVAGVPMGYGFDIYHYGPYCDRLSRDVEWLLADGVIKDSSANPEKYSNYAPDGAINDLLGRHPSVDGHKAVIAAVVKSLLPLDPVRLEVLATLDFLYRQFKAGGGSGPWKDRVVEKFMAVKKDKFPLQNVVETYDGLVAAKLFSEA